MITSIVNINNSPQYIKHKLLLASLTGKDTNTDKPE